MHLNSFRYVADAVEIKARCDGVAAIRSGFLFSLLDEEVAKNQVAVKRSNDVFGGCSGIDLQAVGILASQRIIFSS